MLRAATSTVAVAEQGIESGRFPATDWPMLVAFTVLALAIGVGTLALIVVEA